MEQITVRLRVRIRLSKFPKENSTTNFISRGLRKRTRPWFKACLRRSIIRLGSRLRTSLYLRETLTIATLQLQKKGFQTAGLSFQYRQAISLTSLASRTLTKYQKNVSKYLRSSQYKCLAEVFQKQLSSPTAVSFQQFRLCFEVSISQDWLIFLRLIQEKMRNTETWILPQLSCKSNWKSGDSFKLWS